MHLRPMYSLFLTLSEQSIALRAPAVHGVSSNDCNERNHLLTHARKLVLVVSLVITIVTTRE